MNTRIKKLEEKTLDDLILELDADDIHSRDSIIDYIVEKIKEGVVVSHIVKKLEIHSNTDWFYIDLCNSMNDLIAINNIKDLKKIEG